MFAPHSPDGAPDGAPVPHGATVTGRRCRWCGWAEVTPGAISAYAAAAGTPQADDLMRDALVRRGIAIAPADETRARCPSCESEEVVDYAWTLDANGQVTPATDSSLKETG